MTEHYTHARQHLLHELARVDLLIQQAVGRLRAQQAQGPDEFQGLYVPDHEVDRILAGTYTIAPDFRSPSASGHALPLLDSVQHVARDIARRVDASRARGVPLRLVDLAERFALTRQDLDILLIALAPEIDLKYERLYAYLQDDVTKKRSSVDLALNLLCATLDAKLAARAVFAPDAPLFKHQLLHLFNDPALTEPPLLSRYFKVDERVISYLLGLDDLDPTLAPYARLVHPDCRLDDLLLASELKRRLALLVRSPGAAQRGVVLLLQGAYGTGKRTVAEAVCRELGREMILIDGGRLTRAEGSVFETAAHLADREARLRHAALYWDDFEALLGDDKRASREMLLRDAADRRGLTFLASETAWEPSDALRGLPFVRVELEPPSHTERVQLWHAALSDLPRDADIDLAVLANQFRFTPGQIHDAAATARRLAEWRAPDSGHITGHDLATACRLHSNRKLATLAHQLTPHYRWQDIILPPDRLAQLREICNYVKHRARVYEAWGFHGKLALGKGLNALFAGPSGTGKTMAADIIAGELGLDLYKIDLSGVVSKYIGETEKNLARIFAEAETSNAILFFDEADALFGKRSEVRDAHDRYANIEIAYLLQKMEEYEGIVILATNLRKNMDDAFVRRMHFTIDFPFPDEWDRRRIWASIWPEQTPHAADLDLGYMAHRFEIAGGNIRNIALAAAFLAAEDDQPIGMRHLIRATQREYQKMGKIVLDGEFGEYQVHARL